MKGYVLIILPFTGFGEGFGVSSFEWLKWKAVMVYGEFV